MAHERKPIRILVSDALGACHETHILVNHVACPPTLRSPTMQQSINLAEKLSTFSEHYRPRTVGQFNGHDLMVVKVKGPFTWHKHDETDDFFLVLTGRLTIQLRDPVERSVVLNPGELFVVPRGIEHRPVADEGEVQILLIEPTGTPNTGDRATAAPRVEI